MEDEISNLGKNLSLSTEEVSGVEIPLGLWHGDSDLPGFSENTPFGPWLRAAHFVNNRNRLHSSTSSRSNSSSYRPSFTIDPLSPPQPTRMNTPRGTSIFGNFQTNNPPPNPIQCTPPPINTKTPHPPMDSHNPTSNLPLPENQNPNTHFSYLNTPPYRTSGKHTFSLHSSSSPSHPPKSSTSPFITPTQVSFLNSPELPPIPNPRNPIMDQAMIRQPLISISEPSPIPF
ncbi:hypothetical protein Salat_2825200 [Sesamum alatum]|uniref:Uncharacterized protein n=1 Tax=Sesamum alatum TaxID=300844 RepID=A0AAE2C9J4_9LAMI|nr:hypothetical protein Salat_2825200 [Sesamum alatum]